MDSYFWFVSTTAVQGQAFDNRSGRGWYVGHGFTVSRSATTASTAPSTLRTPHEPRWFYAGTVCSAMTHVLPPISRPETHAISYSHGYSANHSTEGLFSTRHPAEPSHSLFPAAFRFPLTRYFRFSKSDF